MEDDLWFPGYPLGRLLTKDLATAPDLLPYPRLSASFPHRENQGLRMPYCLGENMTPLKRADTDQVESIDNFIQMKLVKIERKPY